MTEVDTEAQQPSAETKEPDLDSLLAEYDNTQEPTPEPEATPAPISNDVQSFMARQMKKEADEAIANSAKAIKDTVGETSLSEKWFEGQLHLAAAKDPRITQAFQERDTNPGRWESIVKSIGNDLKQEIGQTDKASTQSWDAVEASQHSAKADKQEEKEPNFNAMSDAEFMQWKMQHS